ncbi:MAG TPA: glycoside hydrolase family 5 protein [Capsulimonadaceae bacterium]
MTQRQPIQYTGVNISGGEWGYIKAKVDPVYGEHYVYPTEAEVDYFAGCGMNIFRIPFSWEIVQPEPLTDLVVVEIERIKAVVDYILAKGAVAVLDPHNFGNYFKETIGGPAVPTAWFADLWTRLATEFAYDARIWYGLINEPFKQSAAEWLPIANAAVAAIRATGATNLIAVPGTNWDGAHSWLASGNDNLLGIVDPLSNWIVEAHQYVDDDSSGTHPEIVSVTIGSERLIQFTEWCREHGKQALLGEFGIPVVDGYAETIHDMIGYMEANRDVWVAFTWWAAGAIWDNYMFACDPLEGGDESPLMTALRPHLQLAC